jgi:hypothetical protein
MSKLKIKIKNKGKAAVITIAILTFFIFLLLVLKSYPVIVEQYYSEGLYAFISHVLHLFFNLFPISVGDILYIAIVAAIIYAIYRFLKLILKKQIRHAGIFLLEIVVAVQTGILLFYLLWGMNYFRPSAAERLNLTDTSYTTARLQAVTTMLIDSANACRARITPVDLAQTNGDIYKTATQAIAKLSSDSANFRTYYPRIKSSLLTPLLNYMGTSGYYNPFTGEAQMNYDIPFFERPVTACHELSHQMGFAAEDEADFVGFLAGSASHNQLLRYSAYHLAVDEFMHSLRSRDSLASNALKARLSAAVRNDFNTERAYWLLYQGKAGILSGFFYDRFLKVNNQPRGLATYNRMVELVMALYKQRAHGWHGDI